MKIILKQSQQNQNYRLIHPAPDVLSAPTTVLTTVVTVLVKTVACAVEVNVAVGRGKDDEQ